MKKIPLLVLLTCLISLQWLQAQDQQKRLFKKSEVKWKKLQKQANNTYAYTLYATARDRKINTRVIVQQGKVTAVLQTIEVPDKPTQRRASIPNPTQQIYTLDKVYEEVKRIWKEIDAENKMTVTYDKNDLLQDAGYDRVDCKGDCYEGYRIRNISTKLGIQEQLILSMVKWEKQKVAWNNSYLFVVTSGSKVAGFSSERTIYVREGKVIKVSETRIDYKKNTASRRLYTKAQRSKTGTLDDIYTYALTKVATLSPQVKDVYFKAENGGIVSLAGSAPKNCEDDCFVGYKIAGIKKL